MSDWNKFVSFLEGLEKKAFVRETYEFQGSYCVIGAAVPTIAAVLGEPVDSLEVDDWGLLSKVSGEEIEDTYEARDVVLELIEKAAGLDPEDALAAQRQNDNYVGTPEERYQHVLAWAKLEALRPARRR
jgi:hypothetical protein